MTQEPISGALDIEPVKDVPEEKLRRKPKRDIIRFTGDRPTAINFEHVTSMYLEGKRITFEFYTKAQFIDCENDEAAKGIFENLLTIWSVDVVE